MAADPDTLHHFAALVAFAAAAPIHVFVIVYGVGSPWYRSGLGRVMLALGASLALIFDLLLSRKVFGAYPGYEWAALGTYIILNLVMWALVVILLIERRAPVRKQKGKP